MANTYTQIYLHIIFAVKGRESLMHKQWKEELYKYICGIVTNSNQKIYAINGMPDHIHFLISIKPNCLISDLIRDIKANSSKWINNKDLFRGKFYWQEGFGGFSVSHSQLDKVINYINNQEIHHSTKSFKDEYLGLLKSYKIDFNDNYVFEWID